MLYSDFPDGSEGKESACNAGDVGSIPGLGRSPGGGHGNPLQYSCLENPEGQRSLAGYSPWSMVYGLWSQTVGHNWATKHSMFYLADILRTSSLRDRTLRSLWGTSLKRGGGEEPESIEVFAVNQVVTQLFLLYLFLPLSLDFLTITSSSLCFLRLNHFLLAWWF